LPFYFSYRGVTHLGRTVTARERGVRRGASASRPDHLTLQIASLRLPIGFVNRQCINANIEKSPEVQSQSAIGNRKSAMFMARVPGIGLLNRTRKSRAEGHEVQLLRELPRIWTRDAARRREMVCFA
jgi:hypothetical protein